MFMDIIGQFLYGTFYFDPSASWPIWALLTALTYVEVAVFVY